jgi:hypothetical protein
MSLKYGALSLLALGIVLLLAFKNYETWTQPIELFPKTQKEEIRPVEKKMEPLPALVPAKGALSVQSYISIAEKNIFNPDRKDFPVLGRGSKPMVRPQVILYGVTIIGDYQVASIANPGRSLQKGERETFPVKLGEKVGEYKVAKISSDRITLEAEGDSFEVLLYDPRVPKKRMDIKTDVKPATVTSTQPAPAGPIPKTTIPASPSTSAEAPRPSPPPQTMVSPPLATGTQTFPPPAIRRGRTIYAPPSGTPAQGSGGNQ